MFDINKIRKDFPILQKKISGYPVSFLDNGATTLKPKVVLEAISDYYNKYTANVHRGDFIWAVEVSEKIQAAREEIAKFINASPKEIIFNSGATESFNTISFWLEDELKAGDEILLNRAEHASNILPWYRVARKTGAKIVFAELDKNKTLTFESIKNSTNKNTKIIAIAGVTNVVGDQRPIKQICMFAKQHNIYTIIDAAQWVSSKITDVKDIGCDFFVFAGHKLYGPTGIGVIYGRKQIIKNIFPNKLGGGMNIDFDDKLNIQPKDIPYRFEGGTQNITGILGLAAACKWLSQVDILDVQKHVNGLKEYAVKLISKINTIEIYNKDIKGAILTLNVKGIFSQDVSSFLSEKGIASRAGNHCAKILNFNGEKNTLRIVFGIYNTKKDVERLYESLNNKNPEDFLDVFFGGSNEL